MAAPKQFGGNNNSARPGFNRGSSYNNNRNRQDFGPRRNERIRAPEVRVIGPRGEQLGIMGTMSALSLARAHDLDLLEVAPNAQPPVCRIVDYGKYLYEESKKQKQQKQAATRLKEVKMRPRIDEHDLMVKVRRAEMFLFNGNKVKVTLMFRIRELEHPEFGFEAVQKLVDAVSHIGVLDSKPKLMGRVISAMLSPVAQSKRKLIHNSSPVADDALGDEEDSGDTEE